MSVIHVMFMALQRADDGVMHRTVFAISIALTAATLILVAAPLGATDDENGVTVAVDLDDFRLTGEVAPGADKRPVDVYCGELTYRGVNDVIVTSPDVEAAIFFGGEWMTARVDGLQVVYSGSDVRCVTAGGPVVDATGAERATWKLEPKDDGELAVRVTG